MSAKSSFIDTVLRGYPVPPLHLRVVKDPRRGIIREVVDGQQRLRALLGYIEGEYRLSTQLDADWSGRSFDQLSEADRSQIENYRFQIYQYSEIEDSVVLEIFSRINTYSISLNAQELRYGKYFGEFKQSVYALSLEYLEFWRANQIFTNQGIARMQEAQFVSELLVMQLDGMQDKKKSLGDFYKNLDESWGNKARKWGREGAIPAQWLSRQDSERRFRSSIESIISVWPGGLRSSVFRRLPLFYTVYSLVYHRLYGVPNVTAPTPRAPMGRESRERLAATLEEASALLDSQAKADRLSGWQRQFVIASAQQTDNIGPRRTRFAVLWDLAALGE
jgi:hypothetical protein